MYNTSPEIRDFIDNLKKNYLIGQVPDDQVFFLVCLVLSLIAEFA